MITPKEFDSIRPFEPEEIPAVAERLAKNEQFRQVIAFLYPGVPFETIIEQIKGCKDNLDFQKKFVYGIVQNLADKLTTGCDMDSSAIDNSGRYTFISNHRDIVLDSAFLSKLLVDNGFSTTCEIAIGDNLLSLPWVKDVVRLNKAFIVERALQMRQMLIASKRLSEYMHFSINEKKENIWIAQRQGRAKDSNDRTQEAILKMMVMGGEGSAIERLTALHLVPLAISYEYDPCDFLKAREMQLKRDNPDWKKSAEDDVISMKTGILGYKGNVHYQCAACIDDYIKQAESLPKGEQFAAIAHKIDLNIWANYKLHKTNYIALDIKNGNENNLGKEYSAEDKAEFNAYIDSRIAKITDVPNKDEAFMRSCILTMYAYPALNKLSKGEATFDN
jgi:hypothetical protein